MKNRLNLVLSALLIASVAISCAPKSHEEQVIATLNKICDIVSQSKDCGAVAEELDNYCFKTRKAFANAYLEASKESQQLIQQNIYDTPLNRAVAATTAYRENKGMGCMTDPRVKKAWTTCHEPIANAQVQAAIGAK